VIRLALAATVLGACSTSNGAAPDPALAAWLEAWPAACAE
jgi:hypothetical protein